MDKPLRYHPLCFTILLLIVWLGFSLRVYRLDAQEIWGDESVSVSARRLKVTEVLLGKTDVHPPLYFFTLREAMLPAGTSVFSIRFVSAFWGVLIVPLVYRIGKRAVGGAVGELAAVIAAVAALQVFYSQEARMYTMATAWAAASLWCAVELLRRTPFARAGRRVGDTCTCAARKRKCRCEGWWIAFIVTSLIGMYTHYFVTFVVIAEGLALLGAARRDRKMFTRLAVATAVVSVIYAPWIPIQRQYAATQAYARWNLLTPGVFIDVVRQTLISWSVIAYNVQPTRMFPGANWGTVVVVAFALVGAIAVIRARRVEAALMLLCVVVVLVLGWAINPILPVFQDRYLMIGTPAYLVLVAVGLQQVSNINFQTLAPALRSGASAGVSNFKSQMSKVVLAAGIVAVIAPQAIALRAWFADPTFVKGGYGKAMTFVSTHAQPGDVLLLNNYMQWGLFDYYRPTNVEAQLVPTGALFSDEKTDAAMMSLAAGRTRAWLVEFGYAAQYDPEHRAERWLAQHGYKQLAQDFPGLRLDLYVLGAGLEGSMPAHRLDARLGKDTALLGYTLGSEFVRPGESVRLTLFWQAINPMTTRYTVFTHLVDSTGKLVAQTDSPPLGGTAPTDSWQVGATIIDRYAIAVPSNAPPGRYELRVGMYPWPDITPLPVTLNGQSSGSYVPLTKISVMP
jgi:mannosyltransferase